MDQNLAYMYMMRDKSRGKLVFNKETLRDEGSKVKLFPLEFLLLHYRTLYHFI